MARNKFIRRESIDAITHLIGNWPEQKINWEEVCRSCEKLLGYVPSRQGLNGHQEIKDAFQAKKAGIRKDVGTHKPLPSSLNVASARIARLNSTVTALKEENSRLRDRLVVWQYNAYKRGLTYGQLDEPLPMIDRERS